MISIKKVKQIREDLELTNLVIFGIDENLKHHVASHGKTSFDAKQSAAFANEMKKLLKWPENMCNSKPLERICENCDYWQRKKIDHSTPIPENWPGKCMHNPDPVIRLAMDRACSHFESKY